MARKKRSLIIPMLFLVAVVALVIGGVVLLGERLYQQKKAELLKAVAGLPSFDEEEAKKSIAKEAGFKYPYSENKPKNIKTLEKECDKLTQQIIDKSYSARIRSAKILEIMRKYSNAKIGQEIKFQLRDTAQVIKGLFKGRANGGAAGIFILIDDGIRNSNKYNIRKIMPEFYYLFTKADSLVKQQESTDKFTAEFDSKKAKYSKEAKQIAEEKVYPKAGFFRTSKGVWLSKNDYLKVELNRLHSIYITNRKNKLKKLQKKYAFLGVIEIEVPKADPENSKKK